MIRDVRPEDAPEIAAIYAYYVVNTTISFELEAPSAVEMRKRTSGSRPAIRGSSMNRMAK